jgi:hypothetical protein
MALMALGLFHRKEVLETRLRHGYSRLARIKTSARTYYFSGAGTMTLKKLLAPVRREVEVEIINGKDNRIRNFVLDHLGRQRFVVLGMENRRQNLAHWALAMGVSGVKRRGRFIPRHILLLDPDVERPCRAQWNSVIDVEPHVPRGRLRRVREEGKEWLARLDGAVAVGLKRQVERRRPPQH